MELSIPTSSDKIGLNRPEIAVKLKIQFFENEFWDKGLWCYSLTKHEILEKGSNGTYVGGVAKNDFNSFLLINESVMTTEHSREFMETT